MARAGQRAPGGTPWKQPPLVKVYEAFTAVAAGRVRLVEDCRALVTSSNGRRTYDVRWSPDGSAMVSDDNGSRWQGYTGYPIIAVLLEQGRLHAHREPLRALAGIDWHELNERYKRRYDEVVAHVLAEARASGADASAIAAEAESVAKELAGLGLVRHSGRRSAGAA